MLVQGMTLDLSVMRRRTRMLADILACLGSGRLYEPTKALEAPGTLAVLRTAARNEDFAPTSDLTVEAAEAGRAPDDSVAARHISSSSRRVRATTGWRRKGFLMRANSKATFAVVAGLIGAFLVSLKLWQCELVWTRTISGSVKSEALQSRRLSNEDKCHPWIQAERVQSVNVEAFGTTSNLQLGGGDGDLRQANRLAYVRLSSASAAAAVQGLRLGRLALFSGHLDVAASLAVRAGPGQKPQRRGGKASAAAVAKELQSGSLEEASTYLEQSHVGGRAVAAAIHRRGARRAKNPDSVEVAAVGRQCGRTAVEHYRTYTESRAFP
ncbi:hypothetical protein BESB_029810 [Besnoitia besnoiti]|uniref:Uncharacterized protein n=1 Tax=Besnoitia besnoiti TaxID=94643 RepID=A0A2A9M634_BESBE|nr:hypothetical protein BESB_029810 [Besnoitia besnoiti]PFH31107.1 hypothetical protein BESB_029810 [Besnoitia besnoiti]